MTNEQIRNARKSFAAQLTNMIKDFERQTGTVVQGINIERETFRRADFAGVTHKDVSLFKGVYVSLDDSQKAHN